MVKLRDEGVVITMHRDVPLHVSSAVGGIVKRALEENTANGRVPDVNEEVFWILHTGGRGIADGVEGRLGLREEKLAATREVMRQYGNTRSSSIFLVMEEMRRTSGREGAAHGWRRSGVEDAHCLRPGPHLGDHAAPSAA